MAKCNFKKPLNCSISMWHGQTNEHEFECFYTMPIKKNHFKKQKIWDSLFEKHSKFQNFDEIFYCGMTRLRNTNSF